MLRILLALFLLIPLPVLADHVPTQPAYGQDLTTDNNAGTITIGILGSDGWEDSPPENYTIFFSGSSGITETNSFCVTTSFGHQTNTWQYYTFSNDDLKYYFADLAGKNFYFAIRSNNETDNSVSTLTTESVYNIYAGVAFEFNQTDWSAPTGTDACNPYVVTTTTTVAPITTEDDAVKEEVVEETTTTSTTLPPPPPPPTTIPPEEIIVDVKVEGVDKTYTQADVNDGTVDRDKERVANQNKFGCYMTDAQIERGDCDIITDDEKPDTETELSDDDVVVLKLEPEDEIKEPELIIEEDIIEEEIKIDVKELEEDFKFEESEIIIEDIPEDIVIIIEDDIVEETPEIPEEVLVEPIQENVKEEPAEVIVLDTVPNKKPEELTKEEVIVEVAEVEEVIKDIVIEEITTEEVIEVLEEVNDIGVQNLEQVTEEVQEVIQAVVEEAIEDVENLTPEQVEVVAEVLQVETEDVEIIAEAVQSDVLVAEAVEEYVERAVENADVEDYTLADVVTEVQYEAFIENPIEVFIDFDNITDINLSNISDDMTQDQKEKAQEVVVPVILTRIASMAAFIFRRS
jgi:hypothetical protein